MPQRNYLSGTVEERYRVYERLGVGAFGEVYRGEDLRLTRDVALKRLRLAISQAEQLGYEKLLALGLGHIAALEFESGDHSDAEAYALRSNAIARPREFTAIVFRNCFYLRKIAQVRGDTSVEEAHKRTLRTYLGRLETAMSEADEFRAELAEAK